MSDLLTDHDSLLECSKTDFEDFKARIARAMDCVSHACGPLTAEEINNGFLYAQECENFDLQSTQFRWNASYTGFVPSKLAWWDNGSYSAYQGDELSDASGEGEYAYEQWDAQNHPTQADKMEGEDYIPF